MFHRIEWRMNIRRFIMGCIVNMIGLVIINVETG